MKLKKFLSAVLSLSFIISAVPTFASETEYFEINMPYFDCTTGTDTTDLIEGHVVLVPVDVTASADVANYSLALLYDSSILTPGITSSSNVISTVMGKGALVSSSGTHYAVSAFNNEIIPGMVYTQIGTATVTPSGYNTEIEYDSMKSFFTSWYSAEVQSTTDEPELYLIFTVNKTVEDLNHVLFDIYEPTCAINTAEQGEATGTADKANACDGAFQVVYDTSKLTAMSTEAAKGNGYYVQKVEALIAGVRYTLDAYNNEDGTTVYKFPVRLTSDAEDASVNVEIIATITDDAEGSANLREMSWGNVTVDMSGTVSSYDTNSKDAI